MFFWNLRIKTYGKVRLLEEEEPAALKAGAPLRFPGALENEELRVPVCLRCHGGSGPFARSPLKRQHAATISFMVEQGFMPPPGFRVSEEERKELRRFVRGL